MNHLQFTKIVIVAWALAITPSFGVEKVSDFKEKMANSDSSSREAAIKNFVYLTLGTVQGHEEEKDALPALENYLSDPDVKVRQFAAAGILMITGQQLKVLSLSPSSNSVPVDSDLQKSLLKATSDTDPVVRQTALEAYATTFKLTPDVENKIIAEFNSQESELPHRPSNRPALIEMLMIGGSPSPHASEFLTGLLDDPKWAPQVATRMATDNCPLSGAALDKLAGKLAAEKDPVNRATYARAIGSYGKQAQQYAPQLRTALANEKDEVTKQNLQAALAKTQ